MEQYHNNDTEVMRRMGRKGGLVGGLARAATLSAERRKSIACLAAKVRWAKQKGPKSADSAEINELFAEWHNVATEIDRLLVRLDQINARLDSEKP